MTTMAVQECRIDGLEGADVNDIDCMVVGGVSLPIVAEQGVAFLILRRGQVIECFERLVHVSVFKY